jgi:UDPglucose 6-dehydrogenase
VLGSDDKELSLTLEQDLGLGCPTVSMGLESAEMVKHALNIYLATCISLSGELSDLAEIMGADMVDVVKALKLDRRVSPYAPLSPGMGFAGGTLGRDVQSLRMLAKNHKYNSKFLNAVYGVNQDRLPYLVTKIMKMYPKLLGKKIGLLGLTYKANTNTLRRSMSMELARMLHMKGAQVRAFDPVIKEPIKGSSYIKVCNEGEDFFKDLDLIVLMTDWKEFLAIEPELIASLCKKKIIIDTKNFLDREKFKTAGFTYIGIGIQ